MGSLIKIYIRFPKLIAQRVFLKKCFDGYLSLAVPKCACQHFAHFDIRKLKFTRYSRNLKASFSILALIDLIALSLIVKLSGAL